MNAREDVLLHNSFADKNGVLKVVTIPGHERDEHVASQRQLAIARAGAVGNNLAFFHVFALVHENFLVDARGGVRPHEFPHGINPNPVFRIVFDFLFAFGQLAVFGDDDLAARDGRDLAALLGHHHGARVAGDPVFEPGRHQRRLGDEERHGLALHVRAHQRAVRVVVLQKRNQ